MKTNGVLSVKSTMTLMQSQVVGSIPEPEQSFNMMLNVQSEGMKNGAIGVEILPESNTNHQVQETYEKEKSNSSFQEIVSVETDDLEKNATILEENSEDFHEKVVEFLKEELGLSEEELEGVMEVLGLTLNDLINGTGLQELMMHLTGAEDMTALLFDEKFCNIMQGMEALLSSVSQELDMTPEELKAALAQLDTIVSEEQVMEEISQEQGLVLKESQENLEETLQKVTLSQEAQEEGVVDSVQEQELNSQMNEESDFSQDMSGSMKKTDATPVQQVTYQQVQTTVNSLGEQITNVIQQTYIDVDNIMTQISEFTKITVQQSMSGIEMQLNPEHLGKIYLQVTSKDGVITAQLAAQNESVKQVLESQMVILRENMEQQGLKVDAVEVTVASHEFEQGLLSNQESQQENAEESQKSQRRFLTADTLDELSGTMTEEESLAAQIMIDHGNSMDVIV